MAVFIADEQARALILWRANFPEWSDNRHELWIRWAVFWVLFGMTPAAFSGSDLAARDAAFVAISAFHSMPVLTGTDFRDREAQFWTNYANHPPAAI